MNRWILGWLDYFSDSFGLGPFVVKKNLTTNHPCSILITHSTIHFYHFPKKIFSSMQTDKLKRWCLFNERINFSEAHQPGTHLSIRKSIPSPFPKTTTQKTSPPSPYDRSSGIDSNHLDIGTPFFQRVVEVCFVLGKGDLRVLLDDTKRGFPGFLVVGTGCEQKVGWNSWSWHPIDFTMLKKLSQEQLLVDCRWCLVLLQLQQIGSLVMVPLESTWEAPSIFQVIYFRLSVTVTTRIITFKAGEPIDIHLPLLLGGATPKIYVF